VPLTATFNPAKWGFPETERNQGKRVDIMVTENPTLIEDPPTLDYPDRGESEVVTEEDTPATQVAKVGEVRVSALSILCMLSALLGFLFFPALAALPLGIVALKRIDESDGALEGRHLAITGLCISVVALAAWLALITAGWVASKLLGDFLALF
tara:strand:- start:266 stop:727 length:462 start_codon:yes stop_codon:yes gene_type:complete